MVTSQTALYHSSLCLDETKVAVNIQSIFFDALAGIEESTLMLQVV